MQIPGCAQDGNYFSGKSSRSFSLLPTLPRTNTAEALPVNNLLCFSSSTLTRNNFLRLAAQ
ncbi:hypothetical protein GCM10011378_15430 [Hymenobacter glacieicola]|uniref:Uncharacterized protein n=1 Tax=Hymenobacter glacieicola TaxID=1562124 RepID=A0ABQ1WNR7_9BACT|nr:hypothetical protein GCM10011378_15430 [Hymenobacter glacieicola]